MMRAFLVIVIGFMTTVSVFAEDTPPVGGDHPAIARYRYREQKATVSGVVTDAQGQAVAGAKVYVFGYQRQSCPFPKVPSLELGRGTTDRVGAFSFESGTMADTNHQICVIAKGHGTKFVSIDPDRKTVDIGRIALPAEQLLRGKVVGLAGKPVDRVTIEVRCLIMDGFQIDWFGSPRPGERLRPLSATSAEDGKFELRGIPGDAIEIWIRIDDERFALYERGTQVGLRQKEGIISLKDDSKKSVEIQLSKPVYVSGIVTRKDSGAVLPKAWVGVTFSDIEVAADSHSASIWTQSDEKGRYRVRCGPWASRVHVYAFAPPGTPCPDWSAGPIEVPKGKAEIDLPVAMPVGILVRGKIVDEGTGRPVAGAGYVHILRREKPRTISGDDANRMYWANEYNYRYSADDGTFEQPVPAGESGVILVKAPNSSYVSQITSSGEIQFGKHLPWWSLVEGLAKVETKSDAKGLTLDIPLTRGATAQGTVVGPKGDVVLRGVVFTDTPLQTHSQQYLGGEQWGRPIKDGRFTVEGCDPSAPTELYFFDPEHQWGTTVRFDPKVQAGKPLKVALEPCGSARVRFLDPKNRPLTGPDSSMSVQASTALMLGFLASDPKPSAMVFPESLYYGFPARTLDPNRYAKLALEKDGTVVYPSLIPGAPYKWVTPNPKGMFQGPPRAIAVTVKPGGTTDLGDATIQMLGLPRGPGQ